MPSWPKHPCAKRGCPNLVEKGHSYCPEHEKEENRVYEKYGRKYKPKERYGKVWTLVRRKYIDEHPLCEECYRNGVVTQAEHVHHIRPIEEGGTNDPENLMSLCRSCHSRIHAKRGDRWK